MKTFIKTLVISSLSLSMFTACSNDMDDNGKGTDTPDIKWTSVTMQLANTAQGFDNKQDLPLTKTGNGEIWPESTPLRSSDEQLQAIYPLENVGHKIYLVKVDNDNNCIATATQVNENDLTLTWKLLLSTDSDNSISIKGEGEDSDCNNPINLKQGDKVYFASTKDITKATAKKSDVLTIPGGDVYAPIGDILFISEAALFVNIDNEQIIFESENAISTGQKDRYELPISSEDTQETMSMIHLERATTLLNVQLAIKTESGNSANNADYIKDYLNQVAKKELITDINKQFRARFFFTGYPNAYDMTRTAPISASTDEYTAISYRWCSPVNEMDFPLVSTSRKFSGFRDMSLPYITPHDFRNSNNQTMIYMTFEILDTNGETPLYRGTIAGEFAAADIMARNTNVVVLYALNVSELGGLLSRPISKSLVTRSAVEDELFGTMIDADVEFEYLTK